MCLCRAPGNIPDIKYNIKDGIIPPRAMKLNVTFCVYPVILRDILDSKSTPVSVAIGHKRIRLAIMTWKIVFRKSILMVGGI